MSVQWPMEKEPFAQRSLFTVLTLVSRLPLKRLTLFQWLSNENDKDPSIQKLVTVLYGARIHRSVEMEYMSELR